MEVVEAAAERRHPLHLQLLVQEPPIGGGDPAVDSEVVRLALAQRRERRANLCAPSRIGRPEIAHRHLRRIVEDEPTPGLAAVAPCGLVFEPF